MTRARRVLVTLIVALGVSVACDGGGGEGGETHWLGECDSDTDCGGGQCLCGVCTRVCRGDADCAGRSRAAACFETTSPGLVKRCADSAPKAAPAICLGTCKRDANCPAGEMCLLGACVAAARDAAAPVARDAGAPVARDAGPPTPGETATRYVHVDAGTSFGAPVEAPPPRLLVEGADSLVGTWAQFNLDGSRCTGDHYDDPRSLRPGICAQLELTRDGTLGGITGRISYLLRAPDSEHYPAGPFAKATDASTGYPTEVAPESYLALQSDTPGVRYRVLDGAFDGKALSFWYSPLDLWTDWCALATPFPFQEDGVSGYRCVPSGATMQNTPLGKLTLCATARDFGICRYGGVEDACICWDGGRSGTLCRGRQACTCTAERCTSDLRSDPIKMIFYVSGDTLRFPSLDATGGLAAGVPMVLRLVSP